MTSVQINSLFEAHLTVSDLDRSITFYQDVVGLQLAHCVPQRHAAFFWIGQPGKSMLGLWSIHSSPMRMRLHIAFETSLDNVIASIGRLKAEGIVPRHGGGGSPIEEPLVIGWMPAASVYFDDPDGHSLEYISMLQEEPQPDRGWVPLSEWRRRAARSSAYDVGRPKSAL